MKLHIELMGIPGSGKSTLGIAARQSLSTHKAKAVDLDGAIALCMRREPTDKLLSKLGGRFLAASSPRVAKRMFSRSQDRFLSLTEFAAQHPGLVVRVLSSQAKEDIAYQRRLWVFKWLLHLFAGFQFVSARLASNEILILDEGFCQKVVTLYGFSESTEHGDLDSEVVSYLTHIPAPDIVVAIDSPIAECERRLESRGWPQGWHLSFDSLTTHERRNVLERSQLAIEIAIEHLRRQGALVLRVNNGGQLEEAERSIHMQLRELRRSGAEQP